MHKKVVITMSSEGHSTSEEAYSQLQKMVNALREVNLWILIDEMSIEDDVIDGPPYRAIEADVATEMNLRKVVMVTDDFHCPRMLREEISNKHISYDCPSIFCDYDVNGNDPSDKCSHFVGTFNFKDKTYTKCSYPKDACE